MKKIKRSFGSRKLYMLGLLIISPLGVCVAAEKTGVIAPCIDLNSKVPIGQDYIFEVSVIDKPSASAWEWIGYEPASFISTLRLPSDTPAGLYCFSKITSHGKTINNMGWLVGFSGYGSSYSGGKGKIKFTKRVEDRSNLREQISQSSEAILELLPNGIKILEDGSKEVSKHLAINQENLTDRYTLQNRGLTYFKDSVYDTSGNSFGLISVTWNPDEFAR